MYHTDYRCAVFVELWNGHKCKEIFIAEIILENKIWKTTKSVLFAICKGKDNIHISVRKVFLACCHGLWNHDFISLSFKPQYQSFKHCFFIAAFEEHFLEYVTRTISLFFHHVKREEVMPGLLPQFIPFIKRHVISMFADIKICPPTSNRFWILHADWKWSKNEKQPPR